MLLRNKTILKLPWLLFYFLFMAKDCLAYELTGFSGGELRLFPSSPSFVGQSHHSGSVMVELELYHGFESGSSLTITPFARLDSADSERSHFDFRELNYLFVAESFEMTFGVSKIFWGSTEVHLIDIINQTDGIETISGDEKLGQPMVRVSYPGNFGTIDAFVLPYFRERISPGEKGRFRLPLPVDQDQAEYESGAKQYHVDYAVRYSHYIENLDFGLSQFWGTAREPIYNLGKNGNGQDVFIPYYQQIRRTGLDFSVVAGRWLWKGEALYQASGIFGDYSAAVAGFEYTMVSLLGSMDLGIISEYLWNDGDRRLAQLYQHDMMLGLRFALNDSASSTLLAGLIYDLDFYSQTYSLEFECRLGTDWQLGLESVIFTNVGIDDPAKVISQDDLVKIEVLYFF